METQYKILVGCFIGLILLVVVFCIFEYLDIGGKRVTQIDVNSGRIRIRYYLFGLNVRQYVHNPPLTALLKRLSMLSTKPDWRYSNISLYCGPLGAISEKWLRKIRKTNIKGSKVGNIHYFCSLFAEYVNSNIKDPEQQKRTVAEFLRLLRCGDTVGMKKLVPECDEAPYFRE